jgi:hypothetical protein
VGYDGAKRKRGSKLYLATSTPSAPVKAIDAATSSPSADHGRHGGYGVVAAGDQSYAVP